MEELGQLYLQELVPRSLLEWQNINCCGGFEKVRVHSRLLVFLQSEAREASFIEVVDSNDVLAPASVRRLSIDNESGSLIKFTNKFPKLRSFICRISEQVQGNKDKKQSQGSGAGQGQEKKQSRSSRDLYDLKFLRGSKFLRVLSMEGSNLTELPDEIGDMIHLRYLRVACTHLKNLPSSIKKLLNLQTLDISGTDINKIDQDFWLIKTLRHVLARKLKLPASVENMKELDDLQTLHGVQLSKQGEDMQLHCGFSKPIKPPEYPLDMMTRLRSLEICGFNHTDHATALESALGNMHLLGHLKLVGDEIPLCVFTEPRLQCLQTMVLDGTVEWPELTALDVIRNRPNLVSLKVSRITDELKVLNEQKKMEPELVTLMYK